MASKARPPRARTILQAVRELCRAFPEVEEIESHGMPAFRARKGKFFAYFSVNHHGNGQVALWLNTPAMEQSRLIAGSKDIFKPQYVGPSGWIGVELNRGFSWKRLAELVRDAYVNSSPKKLVAALGRTPKDLPKVAGPTKKMTPAEIDRLKSPRALKMLATLRKICLALPETSEGTSFGAITWRAGKKTFASLSDYGKGLTLSFWTGIERQGPLGMDPRLSIPPYLGHAGWMALDLSMGASAEEIRQFVVESYRHFATARAMKRLEGR
jgi:predicted DNA-binding protein (MmcQ/YjbR family)